MAVGGRRVGVEPPDRPDGNWLARGCLEGVPAPRPVDGAAGRVEGVAGLSRPSAGRHWLPWRCSQPPFGVR